jgi:hypothetical protein
VFEASFSLFWHKNFLSLFLRKKSLIDTFGDPFVRSFFAVSKDLRVFLRPNKFITSYKKTDIKLASEANAGSPGRGIRMRLRLEQLLRFTASDR